MAVDKEFDSFDSGQRYADATPKTPEQLGVTDSLNSELVLGQTGLPKEALDGLDNRCSCLAHDALDNQGKYAPIVSDHPGIQQAHRGR